MMIQTIENNILKKIGKAKKGTLFFTEDFLSFGNAKAVSKVLERLVLSGDLQRVARGIYARLPTDPLLGLLRPTTADFAEAIRRRDKARILPTGSMALNALGLSTQIPVNVVYYTDGSARRIDLGNQRIVFKKTSPKNLSAIGKISSLVILALREIGKDHVTEEQKKIILAHLEKEEPHRLQHDIKIAPEWMRKIMRQSIKK
jgi:hypothetical protein